ncbi:MULTISPECIES: cytochrome b/b6 domain-containing protein [Methylomonas]|uniref:Cytochrome B n=1 Tax=Methylomonas koyamae TaxID=702114 RepID=A0A177P3V9_9GAMM|nr:MULTISPECIES: cytochrome b/b6 domain-containing protein [Methylomonas]OAI24040.1 cytochrome B [Methylomonas koyamae]OHX34469.1 cytochrome B [Methylomonas sp. LWB]WGS88060.1 cytochrome b/b6 domain-containing protein [Methylomonas sp. UP202]
MKVEVHVWDWPLRLFHWLLVLAVTGAYLTGKAGGEWTDWHGRFGSLTLGLVVFRLLWGFVGNTHARFVNFFPTLSRLLAYVRGDWQGVGHNPAGALAVFALLTVLAVLVGTGLFANDDIAFEGPLFDLIDKDFSDKLSGWHIRSVNVLLFLVGAHVAAIAFYQRVKKADLVVPMLTGKKRLPRSLAPADARPAGVLRLTASLLIAATVVWSVWGGDPLRYLPPLAGVRSAQAGGR